MIFIKLMKIVPVNTEKRKKFCFFLFLIKMMIN